MKLFLSDRKLKELIDEAVNARIKQPSLVEIDIIRDKSAIAFDFNDPHISVFSIERVDVETLSEKTLISLHYLQPNGEFVTEKDSNTPICKEYVYFISRNQHNLLCEAWRQSMKETL